MGSGRPARQPRARARGGGPTAGGERSDVHSVLRAARGGEGRALRMAVQPIIDLRTGRLVGYEALARFPGGRPPAACFAQAYRQGVGFELEATAIATALALPGRATGKYLAVNLSAAALASSEVQAVLPDDLDELVLEITEHEPLGDDPRLRAALEDARSRGARLAVDDAGSGYAGLKQVAALAPDIIKLDRSLIASVHEDPVKAALIEAFVRYARGAGAAVVAEGIESLDELTRLAALDVPFGQGFAIARPDAAWPAPARPAVEACTAATSQTLMTVPERLTEDANDRRLEALTGLLSRAVSYADLARAMQAIAEELSSDEVTLSARHRDELLVIGRTGPDLTTERYPVARYPLTRRVLELGEVAQVLAGDPEADRREVELLRQFGYGSLLMLQVTCAGEAIGLLEAFAAEERPWSRFEIRRARIISYQLGAVLERLHRDRRRDGLPAFV